jgi:hypothetical protein
VHFLAQESDCFVSPEGYSLAQLKQRSGSSEKVIQKSEHSLLPESGDFFYTASLRRLEQAELGAMGCSENSPGGFRCAETRLSSRA